MDAILTGIGLILAFTAALYLMDWIDGWLHRWRTRRQKERLRWKD